MNEEKRPGGLTALAVINFIFSGWGLIGLIGLAALFAFIGKIPTDDMQEAQKAQIVAFQNMGLPVFIIIFLLSILSSVLLLLSGIGYLKQKKFLGRTIGNLYGVISIISSVVSGILFSSDLGGGFNIMTMVGLIYPVLTLILLNTTFKEDLTN
ncbi:MAG: hypothetical protein H8D56_02080 [Planctomycetes bacterium]|nr:hypothetical protein [Planctomycetota bacterium]MBL7146380.1 hypothetical protein [Phycisphaerae bacterium]